MIDPGVVSVSGSKRSVARIHRLKAASLIGALVLVAAACGAGSEPGISATAPVASSDAPSSVSSTSVPPGSPPTSSSTTSTTAVPVRGVDWESVDPGFVATDAVVVGDRLWVSGRDRATNGTQESKLILAFTDDGRTWERVDLASLGMPVRVSGRSNGAVQGSSVLANIDGDLYALFSPSAVDRVSADGAKGDMWLVTTAGAADGKVVAFGPAATGMDQRIGEPDRIDPEALKYTNYSDFRVNGLGGLAGRDGQIHIVIDGQRWAPKNTTDSDVTVFTLSGTELENVYNENKFGGGFIEYAGIAALGDSYVLVGRRGDRPRVLFSYVTIDGVDWLEAEAEPPEGEWAEVFDLATNSSRLVAAGSERPGWGDPVTEDFPVSWWSDDGFEWNRVELSLQVTAAMRAVGAVWTGSGFLLVGENNEVTPSISAIWESPDGIDWSELTTGDLPQMTVADVAVWGDRLVVVGTARKSGVIAFTPPMP
jgi:hypothetical protein